MTRRVVPWSLLFPLLGAVASLGLACSSAPAAQTGPDASDDVATPGDDGGSPGDDAASLVDAGPDVDKSAPCAATFGTGLTDAFARIDGTVVAVVPPNDQACAMPNSTHLVIQVLMGGAVYRMVVDVLSSYGPPDVLFHEIDAPLAGPTWADGWHTDAPLDYVTTLGTHSGDFTAMAQSDLVAKITSEIDLGAPISIYATSAGSPNSAHLVHRNLVNADGAIVIHPDSAQPHWLLLHFSEQVF